MSARNPSALTLFAGPFILGVIVLYSQPQLFVWLLAWCGAAVVVASLYGAARLAQKNGELEAELERQEAEYDAELQLLHDALSEAQIEAGVILPFVPRQRLPMSSEEWRAIEAETVVHDAWLERLITRPFEDGAS